MHAELATASLALTWKLAKSPLRTLAAAQRPPIVCHDGC